MPPYDESANSVSKETILCALSNKSIASSLSDRVLYSTIHEEMNRGELEMDNELIDACTYLLWIRHSTLTQRQLESSERQSLKQLRQRLKRDTTLSRLKGFPLRPIAIAITIVLVIALPLLITNPPFRIFMPPDEEQYLVVGIQKNDAGIAKATINRDTIGATYELDSFEEIVSYLGYMMELPSWIPEECSLESIMLDRDVVYDELFITYAGNNDKRISILVTHYDIREGYSVGYEQVKEGKYQKLQNGTSIYVVTNINSVWGLYQSSNMDYSIDMTGFDETDLMRVFNSIRR